METKLTLIIVAVSFIFGCYTGVVVNKDQDAGCTVTFRHGNETHVIVGKTK